MKFIMTTLKATLKFKSIEAIKTKFNLLKTKTLC